MRIAITKPLFAWDALEDSPSLQSLRALLEAIPDHPLLESLRAARGKGRDEYPVEALWGTLVLAIALRHVSIEACLEELRRNPALRLLIAIEREDRVPGPDNMSRFLATLGEEPHPGHLRRIFDAQVGRLGAVIGDFGVDTAGDSTGLSGRAAVSEKLRAAEVEQGLPQPSGGRKEYKDDDGNVTKVVEWFGYKLHLLVDVKHESGVAQEIGVILPKKTLLELGKLLSEGEGDIQFEAGENHLFFDVGGRILISRMIDGQFPAYERVIPKSNDKRIDFDRDRLSAAVRRVRLLSNERSKAVKFVIGKDQVEITSSTPEVGEAHEVIPVDYGGDAMQICFNADYVDNFLGVVETESVRLEFKDEMSQAVIKPIGAEGYDYTYVIMPMRI